MATEVELAKALLNVWRKEEANLELRVIDQQDELAATKRELDILRKGIEALAARAGDEAAAEAVDDTAKLTDDQKSNGEVPRDSGGYSPSSQPRRRTPAIVVEILQEINQPMTRDEIYEEFKRRGLTEGYSRPLNAVTTAVQRARNRGWIVEIDHFGRYALPSSTDEGTS